MPEENVNIFEDEDFQIESELTDEEAALLGTISEPGEETEENKTEDGKIIHESEEQFLQSIEKVESEEETVETEKEETEEENQDADVSEYFKTVGEGLFKLGKFGELPSDFKWTQETFLEKFEELAEQNANIKVEELLTDKWGEEGIEMFNDIFIKKVPIKQYLSRYAEIQDMSSIDLDSPSNQKMVVEKYLRMINPKVSDEEIFEQIEYLEEKEKLAEKSELFKRTLVEEQKREMQRIANEQQARITAQKEAEKARFLAIKETVTKAIAEKEINGIPLSVKDSSSLLSYISDKAYTLSNGGHITEFDKDLFELKKDPVKLVALAKLVKEGLNIKPIENKVKDKAGKEIFDFKKNAKIPEGKPRKNTMLDILSNLP